MEFNFLIISYEPMVQTSLDIHLLSVSVLMKTLRRLSHNNTGIWGRKVSKTLGNVIDPIDTIKEFGGGALWFTLAQGNAGQDLNLSTERLTSNKAFTNKLGDVGKLNLQNLSSQCDTSAWETILAYKACLFLYHRCPGRLGWQPLP